MASITNYSDAYQKKLNERRFTDIEATLEEHDKKFENITKLLKLLQSFTEN
jgi:hypothetical protein